jgi:murein tripeptide amidase MpaA
LAQTYPQLVTREVLVQSFERRDVFALKISRGGFGNKPIIFIDGGMHAREWVSQASLMYFLHRLIEDPTTSNELLNNLDWIIIPNLNPDGYVWAFNENRMWRKNRNLAVANCDGIDLNRNFRFSWRAATIIQTVIDSPFLLSFFSKPFDFNSVARSLSLARLRFQKSSRGL